MNATRAFALEPAAVAAAVWDACVIDVRAFKPGNVSVASPGHGMQADDFIASADAMAPAIAAPAAGVGERIERAIQATRAAVQVNTNLGIVLLCAPLVHAVSVVSEEVVLHERLRRALMALDENDTVAAYRAIRLAAPGGLGRAEHHDIADEPRVTLREAMDAARARDRIAYQYVSGFRDIYEIGLPALQHGLASWRNRSWAAVHVFLVFLSRFVDSHIARKHGEATAESVSSQARTLGKALGRSRDPAQLMPALAAFDAELKSRSINPGTSADLTVATLVAMDLEDSLDEAAQGRRAEIGASG